MPPAPNWTKKMPKVTHWLWHHDREWFNQCKQRIPRKKREPSNRVKNEDSTGAILVEKGAELLRRSEGRPIRITTSSLQRMLPKNEAQIVEICREAPLTRESLRRNVDTDLSVAKRRLTWGLEQTAGRRISAWKFRWIASLQSLSRKVPEIREMVKNAVAGKPWQ